MGMIWMMKKEPFQSTDVGVMISFGVRSFISDGLAFNFELIGGYGLNDINAEDWRLRNASNIYEASNNAFGGVQIGLVYYFIN